MPNQPTIKRVRIIKDGSHNGADYKKGQIWNVTHQEENVVDAELNGKKLE